MKVTVYYIKNIIITRGTEQGGLIHQYEVTLMEVIMIKRFLLLSLIPAILFSNTQNTYCSTRQASGPDDYEYLIITTNALKNSYGTFIEFNKRRCLRTKVQTIEYIKTNVTGSDDAEKLRNYIKEQHEVHNIVYLLLGGDCNTGPSSIPTREFRARFYDGYQSPDRFKDEKNIASDMYFGCLEGDWKGDSSFYGEGNDDLTFEVYVSRFPANSPAELENMINKTIAYSEDPVTDQVTNILLSGTFLMDNYYTVWGADYVEQLLGVCDSNYYTTQGFPADTWNVGRLYDKTHDSLNGWNHIDFRDSVMAYKPSVINYYGLSNHWYSFCGNSANINETNYTNTGQDANFYILASISNHSADFDWPDSQSCILEKFMAIQTGAVAAVGCSGYELCDDYGTDGILLRVFRNFYDALFNPEKRIHHLGMMLASAKEINAPLYHNAAIDTAPYYGAVRYAVYETNLFGDPALSVWTDTPKELTPNMPNLTGPTYAWESGLPRAWLAFVDKNNSIIYTIQADRDGKFVIDTNNNQALVDYINNNSLGDIKKVRIKAHNYLPYEGPINQIGINNGKISFSYNSFCRRGNGFSLQYYLSTRTPVNIAIYNCKGVLIKTIVNDMKDKGKHSIAYNTESLSSGIYYCTLKTLHTCSVNKFIIAK